MPRPAGWTESKAGLKHVEPMRYETYCLMCGRGDGPGGMFRELQNLPRQLALCAHCGGRMMVRDLDSSEWARIRAVVAA